MPALRRKHLKASSNSSFRMLSLFSSFIIELALVGENYRHELSRSHPSLGGWRGLIHDSDPPNDDTDAITPRALYSPPAICGEIHNVHRLFDYDCLLAMASITRFLPKSQRY